MRSPPPVLKRAPARSAQGATPNRSCCGPDKRLTGGLEADGNYGHKVGAYSKYNAAKKAAPTAITQTARMAESRSRALRMNTAASSTGAAWPASERPTRRPPAATSSQRPTAWSSDDPTLAWATEPESLPPTRCQNLILRRRSVQRWHRSDSIEYHPYFDIMCRLSRDGS